MIIKFSLLTRKSWTQHIAYSFVWVLPILILSANIGEGVAVKKLLKIKYLTKVGSTQMSSFELDKIHQIAQKLEIKKPVTKLDDDGATDDSLYKITNRSKRYVLQGSRWPLKNLTYKISNYPKRLKKSDVDEEISKAFNVWSEYSLLSFTAKSSGSVDIDISFDDIENGDPFDGPGKVLARSYFPISGGDVYFDIAENWTIGKQRGINLFQAAAHEIGHSLGLRHSKRKSALMASEYRGFNPNFKLDQDDILAIQALYGSRIKKKH